MRTTVTNHMLHHSATATLPPLAQDELAWDEICDCIT